MCGHRRTEAGATALLTALLGVVLMGAGALAVDVGQAYAKRSLVQTDVDLAVMAAAAELDSDGGCNDEVVETATEYLDKADNRVNGQGVIDLGGTAGDADGYISCANWRVDLWAPQAQVDYGLAPVLGVDGTQVNAHAAAQIKAAAPAVSLPFYAAEDCQSGPQVIRDNSGPSSPATAVPPLVPDSAAHNDAEFTIAPTSVATGTTSATITLTGSDFNGVDAVAFTGPAGPTDHHEALVSPVATRTTTTITVSVPSAVLTAPGNWWVRVVAGPRFSTMSEAKLFSVGPPRLYCATSNEGNFGTIDLPRSDTNSLTLQWNIALGVQPQLAVHPSPNGECDRQDESVVSVSGPVDGTNCVFTEPGLKIAQTNEGLVTGAGGKPGRLDAGSTHECSRNHDNGRTAATVGGIHLNDDVLTCFIINGADIGDLVDGTSDGAGALSSDIYSSPRFFWLPVLSGDPGNGRKAWPIVARRPGFITDQNLTATHDAPGTISDLNGLVTGPSGIREVHIVLFDVAALPPVAAVEGGESDYKGSGPKVVVLVD